MQIKVVSILFFEALRLNQERLFFLNLSIRLKYSRRKVLEIKF